MNNELRSEKQTEREPNIYNLPHSTAKFIRDALSSLPEHFVFENERLDPELVRQYREALLTIPIVADLREKMALDLESIRHARGYIVIDGLVDKLDEADLTIPTAVASLAGHPFAMVDKLGLWQNLGVDLSAEKFRFQGIGQNPFHIDAVNTVRPPDYFVFQSYRTDPAGGGRSTLSNLQNMVDELTPSEVAYLSEPRFSEGHFYGMSGVGGELNPFPVLQMQENGLWLVRYTGKILPGMAESYDKDILNKIGSILERNQEVFLLESGQLLIANQHILAHGREPLGPHQELIDPDRRRFIKQSYLREVDNF